MAIAKQELPRLRNFTQKIAIADINAGATLIIPGKVGRSIVVKDFYFCARGGAVGAVTTIDLKTNEAAPTAIVEAAQANLTQDTVLRAGDTGAAGDKLGEVLANGAGITLGKTGNNITTATHVVVSVDYIYV